MAADPDTAELPRQRPVGLEVRPAVGSKREQASLAHAVDVGEVLVDVAERPGRRLRLVGAAHQVTVARVAEDVVEPRAHRARRLELAEAREGGGQVGEQALQQHQQHQDPFEGR